MFEHQYTDTRIPGRRRLATFDGCQLREPMATHVSSSRADDFNASLGIVDLSAMDVVTMEASGCRFDRTPALVTESDPELYAMVLPMDGGLTLTQGGRDAQFGPDQLGLLSSSMPFRIDLSHNRQQAKLLRLQLTKAQLPLPDHTLDELTAVPISTQYGFGALLKDFLRRLTRRTTEFGAGDPHQLTDLATGLITALLTPQQGQRSGPSYGLGTDVLRTALVQQISDHVHDHLSDPTLSPRSIAAAHHISIGHLHRLFERRGHTVAAWIRGLRLERARQDLQDPAQDQVPIHRVAAHWGFVDHSTFTRAFRREYGMPPQEVRLSRLRASASARVPVRSRDRQVRARP